MKLVITQPAKYRLKDIHDYYRDNVSVAIADKIKLGIIEHLRHIADYPLAE